MVSLIIDRVYKNMTGRLSLLSAAFLMSFAVILIGPNQVTALQESAAAPSHEELAESIEASVSWLSNSHQNSDGGYSSFSIGSDQAPSDISGTTDALWSVSAGGGDTAAILNYLKSQPDAMLTFAEIDGSTAGKVVLSLIEAGENPQDYGHDFVAVLQNHLTSAGDFSVESAFAYSLAVLALDAAGEPIPETALNWLKENQGSEGELTGSWDDGFGTAGNPDATSMAVMALLSGGIKHDSEVIEQAESFLLSSQLTTGGWEYGQGFGENANSTALVIQALLELGYGQDELQSQFAENGLDPASVLLGWQGDSGAFQADFGSGPSDDFFATVQTLPALAALKASTEEAESDFFGGDSLVPYFMIGLVALVFVILVVWYMRASRSSS